MPAQVTVRVDSPSGTITLNRPECHNALTPELVAELAQAFGDLLLEKRVRAVILAGAGPSFCVGTDLKQLQASYEEEDHFVRWHEEVNALKDLIETILRFPKPVIAAVSGSVAGTGLSLMLAADLVIAGHDLRLSLPEPKRGLSSGLTIPLVCFRSGSLATVQTMLSGASYDAAAAKDWGLVHQIVAPDLTWVHSQQCAEEFALGARESHQMIKRMVNETIGEPVFRQLAIGAADMASARITDAAREGIDAFLEKRPPRW